MANTIFPGIQLSYIMGTNLQYFRLTINIENQKKILNNLKLSLKVLNLRNKQKVAKKFQVSHKDQHILDTFQFDSGSMDIFASYNNNIPKMMNIFSLELALKKSQKLAVKRKRRSKMYLHMQQRVIQLKLSIELLKLTFECFLVAEGQVTEVNFHITYSNAVVSNLENARS